MAQLLHLPNRRTMGPNYPIARVVSFLYHIVRSYVTLMVGGVVAPANSIQRIVHCWAGKAFETCVVNCGGLSVEGWNAKPLPAGRIL